MRSVRKNSEWLFMATVEKAGWKDGSQNGFCAFLLQTVKESKAQSCQKCEETNESERLRKGRGVTGQQEECTGLLSDGGS